MSFTNGRPTAESVRVGVIGAGYWGKNLVRNFHQLGSLQVVCDEFASTREAIAQQYSDVPVIGNYEEVLSEPSIDAVAIATPAETHSTFVREALLAGKDVFVEKPLCLCVQEGQALAKLAFGH